MLGGNSCGLLLANFGFIATRPTIRASPLSSKRLFDSTSPRQGASVYRRRLSSTDELFLRLSIWPFGEEESLIVMIKSLPETSIWTARLFPQAFEAIR